MKLDALLEAGAVQERPKPGRKGIQEYVLTSTEHCLRCLDSSITVHYRARVPQRVGPNAQAEDDDLLLVYPDGWVAQPGASPALSGSLMQRRQIKTLLGATRAQQVAHLYGVVVVEPGPTPANPSHA